MRADEYATMHALELRHWWFRGRRRVLVDLVKGIAKARAGAPRILDYGCGTGGNTPSYAPFGTVIGIEPDDAAVRLAAQRVGGWYCRGSGVELPFRDRVFDIVVASDVLEHIQDDFTAVSEIARVMRFGGTAVFSVPAHQWLFSKHDAALHHYRRYSKNGLRHLLELGGLRIRRLSYWNSTLFPAICLYRLLIRPRQSQGVRSDTSSSPWLINESLAGLLTLEAAILRRGPLPWGLSLIGVAERS